MALHPPKVWGQFLDDVYSILKCRHLENFFITSVILTKTLKLDSHLPESLFLFTSMKALKMMKNNSYFVLKALLVLEIFTFLF